MQEQCVNRWRLEADVRPGDFAVVDRERTEGVLWTSAFFSEKNAYFVKAGSCVVVLSAPEGPRRLAVMVLCDGRVGWTSVYCLEMADDVS